MKRIDRRRIGTLALRVCARAASAGPVPIAVDGDLPARGSWRARNVLASQVGASILEHGGNAPWTQPSRPTP